MPMFIAALIVMALFYQMFFRYETYQSEKHPDQMVERDSLTGDERVLKAGAKVSVFGHLLGSRSSDEGESKLIQPWEADHDDVPVRRTHVDNGEAAEGRIDLNDEQLNDHQLVEKVARPVPVPREVVVASSAPPVPVAGNPEEPEQIADAAKPFAIRQVDLNKDGSSEEIIQNATRADGLLDISIVKNGKEIFYGRGQQISLLPSRSQGWADIVLKMGARTLQVFRYDPKDAAYRAMDHKS
jgi:hypothetical protein